MRIISHYPQTEEDKKKLSRKATVLHSQALFRLLERLSCPSSQKKALFEAILKENESLQDMDTTSLLPHSEHMSST